VRQGSLAVARPLDLSGRNAWLARPLFHPLVAHREHFSQRCPALPQHFVQDHSHRGLCNRESLSHRDFYSRPLPAALDFLSPSPLPSHPSSQPARRLRRPRVVSLARDYFFPFFLLFPFFFFFLFFFPFFISPANRNRSCALRCVARTGVIYGGSCSPSGLSINYGQFSSLAFIYAVSNVCARCIAVVVNAARARARAGCCKYLMSSRSHVADLSAGSPATCAEKKSVASIFQTAGRHSRSYRTQFMPL